jgi:hypothetical protein
VAQQVNPVDPQSDEAQAVRAKFDENVNMTASELERWLETDESKAVGQKDGGESVGHDSGRRIAKILVKKGDDLTAEDLGHMKKVNAYVSRHLEQRPKGSPEELAEKRWTHSLKNWGHDPLK